MRISISSAVLTLATLALPAIALAQKQPRVSARILNAKTIYFENKTASDAVGANTLDQLKKWGKFQIVSDPKKADLILLLTADPYRDGELFYPAAKPATSIRRATSPKIAFLTTTGQLPRAKPTSP